MVMNDNDSDLPFELRAAVNKLAAHTASDEVVKRSLASISRREDDCIERRSSHASAWHLRRWTLAATLAVCILWFGAQSELWAQVAVDFQQSALPVESNPDTSPTKLPTSSTDVTISPVFRFILLLHVSTLLLGLLGMAIVWLLSCCEIWTAAFKRERRGHWTRTILSISIVTYAVGILFGCVWASAMWGSAWRWDPREAFALVTLCGGVVWRLSIMGKCLNDMVACIRHAIVACLTFWLAILGVFLGSTYAAEIHSYGFPSAVPNIIVVILAVNLAMIGAAALFKRSAWREIA